MAGLHDGAYAVIREGAGGDQEASGAQDAGDFAEGSGQIVEMLEQLIANHQIQAGLGQGELAEVLVGEVLSLGVGPVGHVFAAQQVGKELTQHGGEEGDRLGAVELELLYMGDPASLEQLLQH